MTGKTRSQKWYVIGTGPFAIEVLDWALDMLGAAASSEFGGFLGDPSGVAPSTLNLPAFDEENLALKSSNFVFNAIADPCIKEKVCGKLADRGVRFERLIHPSAVVRASSIEEGTIICPNTVIGAHAKLERLVTVNYHCGIGHEAEVADFCTLAPGVQIGGRTTVGKGTNIGLSAALIDNLKVGEYVKVNAGAVVISRVRSGTKVSGNPARKNEVF